MTLDNGATDRQSDTHPANLRCVERFEESVRAFRVEPYARILHREAHTIALRLAPF